MPADAVLGHSAVDRFKNNAYDLVVEGESYRCRLRPDLNKDAPAALVIKGLTPRRRRRRPKHRWRAERRLLAEPPVSTPCSALYDLPLLWSGSHWTHDPGNRWPHWGGAASNRIGISERFHTEAIHLLRPERLIRSAGGNCWRPGGRMRFVEGIEDVGRAHSELRRRNLPAEAPPLSRARSPDSAD